MCIRDREEVLLAILGGDEAEAAVGDDLLDCSCGHGDPFLFPNQTQTHGLFEKERSTTRESPHNTATQRVYAMWPSARDNDTARDDDVASPGDAKPGISEPPYPGLSLIHI